MTAKLRVWRWIALFFTIANIAFNYIYNTIDNVPRISEVTDKHLNLFTPAGYAFSIWGLIYLSFILYGTVQLLSSQRDVKIYDSLAIPYTLSNIGASIWILAYTNNMIALSMAIIAGMLVLSIVMLVLAHSAVKIQAQSQWLLIPFSLFAGWISVANIANASVLFVSLNWNGEPFNELIWTIIMIGIASILGILISRRLRNLIFPAVIIWAVVGIYIARETDYPVVANAALIAAGVLVLWCIGLSVWIARQRNLNRSTSV